MISCIFYLMLILASMASMEETSQDMAEQEKTLPSTGNQTLLQENKKKGGRRARPTTGIKYLECTSMAYKTEIRLFKAFCMTAMNVFLNFTSKLLSTFKTYFSKVALVDGHP